MTLCAPAPVASLSPEFLAWFGDSQIVDAAGRPRVMYHGTKVPFSVFAPGTHGSCFTANLREADRFSGLSGRLIKVYLRVANPFVTDLAGWNRQRPSPRVVKEAGEHDGYIVRDWSGPGGDLVMVFSPAQIKSADMNCGDFDPNNPDFRA